MLCYIQYNSALDSDYVLTTRQTPIPPEPPDEHTPPRPLSTGNHEPHAAQQHYNQQGGQEARTRAAAGRCGPGVRGVDPGARAGRRVALAGAAGGVGDGGGRFLDEEGLDDGQRGHLLAHAVRAVPDALGGGPVLAAGDSVVAAAVREGLARGDAVWGA